MRAGKVLIATNAYGGHLDPTLARTYFPLKVFQIATEPLPASVRQRLLPGGQCVSDTRRNLFTFRFDAENRLITGGMHVIGPGADERVPRAIHRRLARHLNLKGIPPLAYSWSGIAAVEPDFLPHLVDLGPGLDRRFCLQRPRHRHDDGDGRACWPTGLPAQSRTICRSPSHRRRRSRFTAYSNMRRTCCSPGACCAIGWTNAPAPDPQKGCACGIGADTAGASCVPLNPQGDAILKHDPEKCETVFGIMLEQKKFETIPARR